MPELTIIHFGLLALVLVAGVAGGWFLHADRCAKEKIAIGAIWQDKLESQQAEQGRLAEQNKSLMQQISQYQASHEDYRNRTQELSDSLKKAVARRDELQSLIKDIRSNLEVAVVQRNRLQSAMDDNNAKDQSEALKDRDDKIFHLSRELTSWQSRVPPLVEKFQERNERVRTLENELEQTRSQLQQLSATADSDQTRVQSVNADTLTNGGDASNEPMAMDMAHETSTLNDQIVEETVDDELLDVLTGDNAFAAVFSATDDDDSVDDDPPEVGADDDGASNDESADNHDEPEGLAGNVDQDDDLMKIHGIGPAIAKTLNEQGIRQFHQLAGMSEYDIDRIALQLRGFRSRIYREDWIGQARDLQLQKKDSPS